MNKSDFILMSLNIMEYMNNNSYINEKIVLDSDINDCLIYMYFYMLSGDSKYYDEFIKIYELLDNQKKEIVKNDYLSIINSQEKNKVKKKER